MKHMDIMRCSPVHCAAENGHLECLQALFIHGADINTKSLYGTTPTYHAARKGQVNTLAFLCESGANCTIRNIDSLSPFRVAQMYQMDLCAQMLNQYTSKLPHSLKVLTSLEVRKKYSDSRRGSLPLDAGFVSKLLSDCQTFTMF